MSITCQLCFTGRKHQLRLHTATALSAPILGDTRYGLTRGWKHDEIVKELHRSMMQTQPMPAINQATSQEALKDAAWMLHGGRSLPLQLHCFLARIHKPQQSEIAVQAEPSQSMSVLLKFFKWTVPMSGFPTMTSTSQQLEL